MRKLLGLCLLAIAACDVPPESGDFVTQQAAESPLYIPPAPKPKEDCDYALWACYEQCLRDTGGSIWYPACIGGCVRHYQICMGFWPIPMAK